MILFQLNEEFDESTPDGRDVKAIATLEDGKIVMVQKAKNEKHKSTRVRFAGSSNPNTYSCFSVRP